jgi:hypothetical protein
MTYNLSFTAVNPAGKRRSRRSVTTSDTPTKTVTAESHWMWLKGNLQAKGEALLPIPKSPILAFLLHG